MGGTRTGVSHVAAGTGRAAARTDIVGLVLAGGASRRMGRDKAGLRLVGQTLIARAVARLAAQVAAVAIAGDPADPLLAAAGPPVLADPLPGRAGPLAGILAGLEWAAARGAARMQVVPVDAPFLPDDLVARLAAVTDGVAVAHAGGRPHPVVVQLPVALRGDLAAFLAGGGSRAVQAWLDAHAPVAVAFQPANGEADPFLNINTPEDFAAALSRVGGAD